MPPPLPPPLSHPPTPTLIHVLPLILAPPLHSHPPCPAPLPSARPDCPPLRTARPLSPRAAPPPGDKLADGAATAGLVLFLGETFLGPIMWTHQPDFGLMRPRALPEFCRLETCFGLRCAWRSRNRSNLLKCAIARCARRVQSRRRRIRAEARPGLGKSLTQALALVSLAPLDPNTPSSATRARLSDRANDIRQQPRATRRGRAV